MVLAVIPARYGSTRLPGKPLLDLDGQTLIQRVYQRVNKAEAIDQTVVATDDKRIFDHVKSFGGRAMMTRSDHPSGTDRVAEVAATFDKAEIVVNVQGDEPFISEEQLEAVIRPLRSVEAGSKFSIATLATKIKEEQVLDSNHVVKVVRGSAGQALYFSRHPIPYLRDRPRREWLKASRHLQHLGLYAFRSSVLSTLTDLPRNELEIDESLEQLRWLAAGFPIHVAITMAPAIGIDTPDDLDRVRAMLT